MPYIHFIVLQQSLLSNQSQILGRHLSLFRCKDFDGARRNTIKFDDLPDEEC